MLRILTTALLGLVLFGCAAENEFLLPSQTINDGTTQKFVDRLKAGYYTFDEKGNAMRILGANGDPITSCPDWQIEYHIYARRPDVLGCKNKPEPAPGPSQPTTCSDYVLTRPDNEHICVKSCQEHGLIGIKRPNADYKECAAPADQNH